MEPANSEEFWQAARRDEGAYLQRSVTEEQRSGLPEGPEDAGSEFMRWLLGKFRPAKQAGAKVALFRRVKHLNTMRSNRDRNLVSGEPYEIEYIHRQFPGRSHQEVVSAIKEAKAQLGGSEDRTRIMQILREKWK
jgi:hypothetical protein